MYLLPKVTQLENARARKTNARIQTPTLIPRSSWHLQHIYSFSPHCTFFCLGGTQGPQIHPSWGLICPCGTTIYSSYCHPHAKSLQSCLTLCNPLDCSLPGSSVHGSFGTRIVEWVAMPSSNYYSQLVTKL